MNPTKESEKEIQVIAGVSTDGDVIKFPLEQMGTVLVSGHIGSNKEMLIRSFLMSILATSRPDEVKFIIADLSGNEYIEYKDMPFMMKNPLRNNEKTLEVMQGLLEEMERRLRIFANGNVKSLASFNEAVERGNIEGGKKLPHIVFVVDEFADVILTENKREVEGIIKRLIQLSRPSGIHLILSTEFPRGEILSSINNMINFRFSLCLPSKSDSQIVLGQSGAEDLQSLGDFYVKINEQRVRRGQTPFISREVLESIFNFIKYGEVNVNFSKTKIRSFWDIIKRKKINVEENEGSIDTLFPLALFKFETEIFCDRKKMVEKRNEMLTIRIKDLVSEHLDMDIKENIITNRYSVYKCTVKGYMGNIPSLNEIKETLETSLEIRGIDVNFSGKYIKITVPLAEKPIPIDVKKMIESTIC